MQITFCDKVRAISRRFFLYFYEAEGNQINRKILCQSFNSMLSWEKGLSMYLVLRSRPQRNHVRDFAYVAYLLVLFLEVVRTDTVCLCGLFIYRSYCRLGHRERYGTATRRCIFSIVTFLIPNPDGSELNKLYSQVFRSIQIAAPQCEFCEIGIQIR